MDIHEYITENDEFVDPYSDNIHWKEDYKYQNGNVNRHKPKSYHKEKGALNCVYNKNNNKVCKYEVGLYPKSKKRHIHCDIVGIHNIYGNWCYFDDTYYIDEDEIFDAMIEEAYCEYVEREREEYEKIVGAERRM